MKLYFAPGACSLSPHIVLREAGIDFQPVQADLKAHKLKDSGADFYAVNPKGQVPVLELDNGDRLTEGPAIVQYLADQAPAKKLAPAAGTMERYRLQEWLNFITSELHKGIGFMFGPAAEDAKTMMRARALDKLKWVDHQLEGRDYLMGEDFSVADAYLFTVTNWTKNTGIDISGLKNLGAFMARMAARPAVQEALKAEGLTK